MKSKRAPTVEQIEKHIFHDAPVRPVEAPPLCVSPVSQKHDTNIQPKYGKNQVWHTQI